MIAFLFTLYFVYAIWVSYMWILWIRERPTDFRASSDRPVTVITVGRNEVQNLPILLEGLSRQSYHNYSFIYVDDLSTDGSLEIVRDFATKAEFPISILSLAEKRQYQSPKMEGLTQAIASVPDDHLLLLTDADCQVSQNWIKSFATSIEQTQAKLISGPVAFGNNPGLWHQFQSIEFASLVGTGACGIMAGHPNMCNGANIAYTKQVFMDVGGFVGLEDRLSGDDEFLMHKVKEAYPNSVKFLKSADAIVITDAQPDLASFINQRQRWGSKWRFYRNPSAKFLAVFVYVFHLSFVMTLCGSLIGLFPYTSFLVLWAIKSIPELLFLSSVLAFLGKGRMYIQVLVISVVHPIYIVMLGAMGTLGSYSWKGRSY